MKLSTRARYGVRAVLDLALHGDQGLVHLKSIALRQQISLQYLEHLITPLIAAGIISSTRGPRGGLSLAMLPAEVKLSQLVSLLEGSTAPVECVTNLRSCDRAAACATRDLWSEMKDAIDSVLESTTLADLMEKQKKKEAQKVEMYFI